MLILGLNMFHADASAAIVKDGEVVFAVAEERLNRKKHFGGFPALAIQACLDFVGATIYDIDHVAVGQDTDANLAKKVQLADAIRPDSELHQNAAAQGVDAGPPHAHHSGVECRSCAAAVYRASS